MTVKQFGRKLLKITGVFLGILLLLLIGFHFWFKAHAKEIIEDLVASKSNGRIKLKIKKLHFGYFSRRIELDNAVFYNTDTNTANTFYRFSIDKMKIEARAILPIVFKKQLLIDSINLINPHIEVTKLRDDDVPDSVQKKNLSVPAAMGKIYRSIQDALQVLEVKRFQIEEGTFVLTDKTEPAQRPVRISHLFFHIDNLHVDTTQLSGHENVFFSENIVLHSYNQNIIFPDDRHRLSFSQFRINLRKQQVEFDSCTIAATRKDSSATAFHVFFDKLLLTSIDFDTLYRHDVIHADSVYCINPQFGLTVEVEKKKSSDRPRPKLEDIIQQLTGDLLINQVIVNNGSLNLNLIKNGQPNTFSSNHNNFEMSGLSIDREAKRPITVKNFAMAIRHSENFLNDSLYSIRFDSIHLNNARIVLSNFVFRKFYHGSVLNSFSMPRFQLTGLSWDDLLFDQKLSAEEATLYDPQIVYNTSPDKVQKAKRVDLFQSLAGINNIMDLQRFNVLNGKINLNTSSGVNLDLDHANMFVESQSLLSSRKISELKRSVGYLDFDKGFIRVKGITAEMNEVSYDGAKESLHAAKVIFSGEKNDLDGYANNVNLNKLIIDDSSRSIHITGIHWSDAHLKMQLPPPATREGERGKKYSILLEDIQTTNTGVDIAAGERTVTGLLQSFTADRFRFIPGRRPEVLNLFIKGRELKMEDKFATLRLGSLQLVNRAPSYATALNYVSKRNNDTISLQLDAIHFNPDLPAILNDHYALQDVVIDKPVLLMRSVKKEIGDTAGNKPLFVDINSLLIRQPVIDIRQYAPKGVTSIAWNTQSIPENSLFLEGLKMQRLSTTQLTLDKLATDICDFHFTAFNGKAYNTQNGKIKTSLRGITMNKTPGNTWDWGGTITSAEASRFVMDSVGRKRGKLEIDSAFLTEFVISAAGIKNRQALINANTTFQLNALNGAYQDASIGLHWYNAGFNRLSRMFTLDSIRYSPTLSRDSFMVRQTRQIDYLNARSGAIIIGPLDIERYAKDSTVHAGRVVIQDAVMTDYKDKRLPYVEGLVKPLPARMVKNIPMRLAVDTLLINNGRIEYTEMSVLTGRAGIVPVTRLTAKIFPIRNFDLHPGDSLRIHANGYLLDTMWMRLRVNESYTDSLEGFKFTFRMKPAALKQLNSILVPLASAKILSGTLDTMSMRAVGREYLAFGEMKMYYHNLRIRILKGGDEKKRSFFNNLLNFLANTFVVKNKNTSHTTAVFFIRDRNRSAINYLIKIAMSGINSSVGVKSSRKFIRKYRREVNMHNLPPIDLE